MKDPRFSQPCFLIREQEPLVIVSLKDKQKQKHFCDQQMISLGNFHCDVALRTKTVINREDFYPCKIWYTMFIQYLESVQCHILLRKPDSHCSTFNYITSHERKCLPAPNRPTTSFKSGALTAIIFFLLQTDDWNLMKIFHHFSKEPFHI